MTALFVTVFLASLMGSLHCVGMCGAFVTLAVGVDAKRGGGPARLQAAYHLGRLTTYSALGAAAGALGGAFDLAGSMAGVQRLAAVIAGATLAGFGTALLLRMLGVRTPRLKLPGALVRLLEAGHRRAMTKPPLVRAATIGLLTTLLPCGWLWAFVVTAAGTARPELGALVMAAFWAGTVPALAAIGVGAQRLLGLVGKRAPTVAALAMIVVGLVTVFDRASISAAIAAPVAGDAAGLVEHVERVSEEGAPCCHVDR